MTKWPRDMMPASKSETTTIWLTLPYSDAGIEKLDAVITDNAIVVRFAGGNRGYANYPENVWWHRTKEGAIEQAKKFRRDRIVKASSEVTRLLALPDLSE